MYPLSASRYRPLIVATTMTALGVAALWMKWSLLSSDTIGWPRDPGRTLAMLFALGVMLAFGAAALSAIRWRRILQSIAATSFIGMLVLPIDLNRLLPAPVYKYRHDDILVTVRVKPDIQSDGQSLVVVLHGAGVPEGPIRLYVDSELASKLREERTLEFTFWRTRDVLLPGWRVTGYAPPWDNRLETVRDGDRMLYDARICPIHHVVMQRMELPIHYGLPLINEATREFSGGPGFLLGGCVGGSQRTAMGYRCPLCVARYEKWVAEQTRRDRQTQ